MRRLAIVAVALLVAGCAHDGRALRTPPVGATAPPVPSSTLPGQTASSASPLTLTSNAFTAGESIPIEHTCDGANVSPPLAWGSVPEATTELAITVTDPDAGGFVHWVMAGLDPSVQAVAIGVVPDGAIQPMNDAGTPGWTGPCPPRGAGPHHYIFTLYALTSPSGVTAAMSGKDAVSTIAKAPGIFAQLVGLYQRA